MAVSEYLARWPDRAPFARHRIYDLGHLEAVTGYRPRFPLADAIAEAVDWLQRQ
jgi:nucleoside-diphosphate-sugar epimerase